MPNLIPVNGAKVGHITIWTGLIANIPAGWQICDGTNGTPDLRSKFIRGVATSSTNPGSTGGADSVTLSTTQLPTHGHSISDPQHSHTFSASHVVDSANFGLDKGLNSSHVETFTNSTTGITVGNTGGGGSHENRPAYYEVAFIMKVQ